MRYSLLRPFTNQFPTFGNQQQQIVRRSQNVFGMPNGAYAQSSLFLQHVSWISGREQIEQHFSRFGKIKLTQLFYDSITGLHRGFAIVQFVSPEGAALAMQNNPHTIDDQVLGVRYHVPKELGQQNNGNMNKRNF